VESAGEGNVREWRIPGEAQTRGRLWLVWLGQRGGGEGGRDELKNWTPGAADAVGRWEPKGTYLEGAWATEGCPLQGMGQGVVQGKKGRAERLWAWFRALRSLQSLPFAGDASNGTHQMGARPHGAARRQGWVQGTLLAATSD